MRIPENTIDEIRNAANVLDIVSGYVQLRKRGKNYIGLCPFHQEKTPSFTVSEDKQIFHCFGCSTGGNVFKFLMEYKSISFVEAVQEVAETVGITISYDKESGSEEQSIQEAYFDINVLAAKYFSNNLLNSEDGESARSYFKKRNIKLQTQKQFGLGYAKPEWEHLLLYLQENKVDLAKALELGLIDKRDDGGYYDKLRGRIIFPIFSPNGRVIAFGGRILEDAKVAKYLNSPESIIYSKRRSLYGLFHSKEEIRSSSKAILVEGYMDLISLFQHGVKNVVASSGTSLTEEQTQLLSRFTKNIIVLFDADEAGQKAAIRSIEILLKQDFDVRVVLLPDNEDPDSYINKYGREKFDEQIIHAPNFLEFQAARFAGAGMFEDPAKHTEAIRELVKTVAFIDDELKRSIHIKTISKKFNLREKLIESELDKHLKQKKVKEERTSISRISIKAESGPAEKKKDELFEASSKFEKVLIKLLFEGNKDIIEIICDNYPPDQFKNSAFQKLATLVCNSYMNDVISPSAIVDKINDEGLKKLVMSLAIDTEAISKRWNEYSYEGNIELDMLKYTKDIIKNYKLNQVESLIKENNRRIAESSDEDEILKLMKFNDELQEEKIMLSQNGRSEIE